jgi:hypothetical protein
MSSSSALRAAARDAVHAWNLLAGVSRAELYRAQARRARDPRTAGLLRELTAREVVNACEARARVPGPDGLRKAAEAAARAGGGALGALSGAAGERVALLVGVALEAASELAYRAGLVLVEGEGSMGERRALERALADERAHGRTLRGRLGLRS